MTTASPYVLSLFVFDAPAPDAVPSPQSPDQEDAARRKAWLVRLGAIGMDMAEKTKADFDAAETPQERREAMGGFPAVARLVQRAIFLEARLERDARMEARLVAQDAARAAHDAVQRRKGRVEGLVQRVIDLAHEDDFERHDAVSESLRWRLDDSFLDRDFADKPIDQVIRAICKGRGVPAPGPIDEETTLWAINLRKQPLPVTEPVPPEAAPPEEDWGPLEGHVPIQSSA